MRLAYVLLLAAALLGGFLLPAFTTAALAAELQPSHTNGQTSEKPLVSVQIVTVLPLAPGETLVMLLVSKEDGEILVALWTWPGGRELAVSSL